MPAHVFDNILRYHVDSATRPQVKHLVDLDLYDGNGACSCEHFNFGLEPHLKKGSRSPTGGLRCRHIKEARDRLADDVIRQAARQLANGVPRRYATNVPLASEVPMTIGPAKTMAEALTRPRKPPPPRKKAGAHRSRRA